MIEHTEKTGRFANGMPYNRSGRGRSPLVIFQGLQFDNKPMPAFFNRAYTFLEADYTVYLVLRKPGMPAGYTLQDMANDYAEMIAQEFGAALDVIGISTGGSIVQYFAADHPHLVRRLVIHSSAYTLGEAGRKLQMQAAQLARQHRWKEIFALFVGSVLPEHGARATFARPITWISSEIMALLTPNDPSDFIVTIEAEDSFNFKARLPEITAPTLVVAGMNDPYYPSELFRETAAGIPNARLILYENMGHPAAGRRFHQDVKEFLR